MPKRQDPQSLPPPSSGLAMGDHGARKPSIALDALFVALMGALMVATPRWEYKLGHGEPGLETVLTGVLIQYLGLLLLASYFFPNASYVLKGLMWCCENWGMPRGRWAAIFWGLFDIALGSAAVAQGLGWAGL